MDDPLSAVDSAVAQHIFEKYLIAIFIIWYNSQFIRCIVDYLSDKIRILVTHQIQFIRKATKILVLDEGKCIGLGTYDELQDKGLDFMKLLSDKDNDRNKKEEKREVDRSYRNWNYETMELKQRTSYKKGKSDSLTEPIKASSRRPFAESFDVILIFKLNFRLVNFCIDIRYIDNKIL